MKKSELRKLIRESIISEQTSQYKYVSIHPCHFYQGSAANVQCGGSNYGMSYGAGRNIKIDGATPQPGDTFYFPGWLNIYNSNTTRFTDACTGCPAQIWRVQNVSANRPNKPNVDWNSAQCGTFPNQGTSYGPCIPGGSTSAGSCNPSAWSNHTNWTSTFTNTVNNFPPSNANQPCNFLNNKITQFTNSLQGSGAGNAQNIWNCKLNLATQLHTQNNC